jgi:hypothetical protein
MIIIVLMLRRLIPVGSLAIVSAWFIHVLLIPNLPHLAHEVAFRHQTLGNTVTTLSDWEGHDHKS